MWRPVTISWRGILSSQKLFKLTKYILYLFKEWTYYSDPCRETVVQIASMLGVERGMWGSEFVVVIVALHASVSRPGQTLIFSSSKRTLGREFQLARGGLC